jgi:cytochrome b561
MQLEQITQDADQHCRSRAAAHSQAGGFDSLIRSLHWLTLGLIISLYISANLIDLAASDGTKAILRQLHRSFGVTVWVITIVRLVWRQFAHFPDWPQHMSERAQFLSKITERLLYLLLLVQPILGFLYTYAHGHVVNLYFLYRIPALLEQNDDLGEFLIDIHGFVANILLCLIAFHAAFVLYQHYRRRNGLLIRMLPQSVKANPNE